MRKQATKIIFSSDRSSRSKNSNKDFQEITASYLDHLVKKGLLESVVEASGVYTYENGQIEIENSFICTLNFHKETEAFSAIKAHAFNDMRQESILYIAYNNQATLLYASDGELRRVKLGEFHKVPSGVLPKPQNYTQLKNGDIYTCK